MPNTSDTKRRQNTGNHPDQAGDLCSEFVRCLGTMSHSRAGWDYQLSPSQRAKEDRAEQEALTRARAIWAENEPLHEMLRAAFADASPLASMGEIANAPDGAIAPHTL